MALSRPVTAVIFDMDGVLLDTERFYTEVTQTIVGRWGKTFDWSIKSNMVGRPARDAACHLIETLALPMTAEEFLRQRDAMLEPLFPRACATPGARELTAALAGRGVPLAVATSSGRRLFELKTSQHRDWFRVFSTVVVGDDPRVARGKPAPDIFLLTAHELGVDPTACLVVEDAAAGVAAAHAAGMQVLAVPDPGNHAGQFRNAELVLRSLAEATPALLGV